MDSTAYQLGYLKRVHTQQRPRIDITMMFSITSTGTWDQFQGQAKKNALIIDEGLGPYDVSDKKHTVLIKKLGNTIKKTLIYKKGGEDSRIWTD